ncbi:hypothetical protein F5X68DRAFT_272290 [Plectosphaerella plurivora]|uniref:Zn(2)-C6 fungal-type domain-containing protein n=1 Tax=Plectosphaerella plurivora TaxID=936078 RepID=A0A9P8VKN6_9PEZI|nr:hypothetical protein F5X68DRAFT_272290 [Plectosphaerella plurivora]
MTEREPDNEQQPRKRIAVACGRCRKRKIRCSGDPGNGEPCTNCRNANAEPCQFLRVASTETPILHDRGSFSYDVETARNHHARQSAPFSPQFAHDMPDGLPRYPTPSSSSSGYPYSAARYYSAAAPWAIAAANPYSDDVDYASMGTYSPSCYGHEQGQYFRMAPTAATARASHASQHHQHPHHAHHGLYADAATASAYPAVHRPAVSIEPSTMSLSSVAAALPPTMDRMLPALGGSSKSLAVADTGYHHLDPVPATYGTKSASTSPNGSPTDSVHDPSGHHYAAYDASSVSAGFTHAASLAGNNHRESTSTGCGSDSYASSTGTTSLFADSEPITRSLPDYSVRSNHTSRRESDSYSLAGPHGYTMPPGPIPSPSIAGRGLHQAQAQAAAAYMISAPNATTSDPSTSPRSKDTVVPHHDMQRTRVASSLSAA